MKISTRSLAIAGVAGVIAWKTHGVLRGVALTFAVLNTIGALALIARGE